MTNQLLQDIGEQLYGPRWQTDLSRADVSDRTMRRWVSGEDSVPEGAWRDIYDQLGRRIAQLESTKQRLSGLLGARPLKHKLQPIPNSKAEADIHGVQFAMHCSSDTQRTIRCFARREIFDDRGCTDRSMMVAFLERHAHSFHLAASVIYEMNGAKGPINIGNDDIICKSLDLI